MEIKKRLCPECQTEMSPRLISMFYEEKEAAISVEVVGIPANVCQKCNLRLIPASIARYIDNTVDPFKELQHLLEKERKIIKVGNSIGLTLPEKLKEIGVHIGQTVKMKPIDKHSLTLTFE